MIVLGELVRKKIDLPHSRTAELRCSIFGRVKNFLPIPTQFMGNFLIKAHNYENRNS